MTKKYIAAGRKFGTPVVALSLLIGGIATRSQAQAPDATAHASPSTGRQSTKEGGKFYCNIAALNPAERAHHQQLSAKLLTARKEIVETPKGYEFQFSPSAISLAELADWVAAETKCCPFFDFHIDLEREGNLLCLRLTGEEGIKPFIRGEFKVPAK